MEHLDLRHPPLVGGVGCEALSFHFRIIEFLLVLKVCIASLLFDPYEEVVAVGFMWCQLHSDALRTNSNALVGSLHPKSKHVDPPESACQQTQPLKR